MSYFRCVLDPETRTKVFNEAVERLRGVDFDVIACRGVSGIMFAAPLAYMLNKHIYVARKSSENSHGGQTTALTLMRLRADEAPIKILLVDDFISTGTTMEEMIADINRKFTRPHTIVGMYLYCQNSAIGRVCASAKHFADNLPLFSRRLPSITGTYEDWS